jgi:hypothetical protein
MLMRMLLRVSMRTWWCTIRAVVRVSAPLLRARRCAPLAADQWGSAAVHYMHRRFLLKTETQPEHSSQAFSIRGAVAPGVASPVVLPLLEAARSGGAHRLVG